MICTVGRIPRLPHSPAPCPSAAAASRHPGLPSAASAPVGSGAC